MVQDCTPKTEKASRRSFLRKAGVVGIVGTCVSEPVFAQSTQAHQTELTLTETEGESIHYIIDVTGNSLEAESKTEDNDEINDESNYSTVEGYLKDGTDIYTFGDSDRISRVVVEGNGNFEATLSGALDSGTKYNVVVRGEHWGEESDDPSMSYSFTSSDVVIKWNSIEDNDEKDSDGNTASGYVDPGFKDVWRTNGQFESIHAKPWGHELNFEVGDLPRGTSD